MNFCLRKIVSCITVSWMLTGSLLADETLAARRLTERLIPSHASCFEFRQLSDSLGIDRYTVESKDDKIIISGNNANAMATGLNFYLKRFCNTTVSWYAEIPVELPDSLPSIPAKLQAKARVSDRFFLNYCTFGYTMPFWGWEEWQRLIDWMALNGVNMPLAITGQEAVWHTVWTRMGMTDNDVRAFFTGPAYLPWHRMANIDAWNGPLPHEWLESQTVLQQKILARERELGMRPVLPAFAGHVPAKLKDLCPNADIKLLGKWAGFSDNYRCHFLNPEDSLFAKIQRMYLEEQTRLFGTDHIYGIDPFNEVDPPCWEPEYLKDISANIFRTLTDVDPKAQWLQMSWMFYHDKKDWTPPRVEALLSGVEPGKMTLLDYHCENVELWKTTDSFHGQPFIWCYLGNFGGNTTITGNLKQSGDRLDKALASAGKNLTGIGSTLEGLDIMQFPYEYIFDKAWDNALPDDKWIEQLADRHVGAPSSNARKAWKILFDDIYIQVARTLGTLTNFRPVLDKHNDHRIRINYENRRLAEAWKLLIDASEIERDAMAVDLICVGRQVLGNLFKEEKFELDSAYHRKDIQGIQEKAALMKSLLADIDSLNAYHPRASLSTWIRDARQYAETPEAADYYERNARNLITTWGGALNDYASRTWAGLIGNYYTPRWEIYLDAVTAATKNGVALDQQQLNDNLSRFENEWVQSLDTITSEAPKMKIKEFSRHLFEKYQSLLQIQ